MMKKILFACFISLFVLSANAQKDEELDNRIKAMKKAGQLNGDESYENPNGGTPLIITIPETNHRRKGGNNQVMSSTECDCWIPRDNTFTVVPFDGSGGSGGPGTPPNYANDDWSTSGITLPFNFCLYGTSYGSGTKKLFINNNGNITFGTAYSTFSSVAFPSSTYTMVAPFWGDVETTNPGSGYVYYQLTPTHLIVQWDSVECYQSYGASAANVNLHNTFQLIITDGTDSILPGGNNVSFCYKNMEWTTGDASSGAGSGFGGTPATVGINKGDGTNYVQVSRFGANNAIFTNPAGSPVSGIQWLANKSFMFDACGSGNNLPPLSTSGMSSCGADTISICAVGDSITQTVSFTGPEPAQHVTVTVSSPDISSGLSVVSSTTGVTGTLTFMVASGVAPLASNSYYTVNVTATDNGTPAASTTITYIIHVLNSALPSPNISVTPSVTCGAGTETITINNASDYDTYNWSNSQTASSFTVNTSGTLQVTVTKDGCSKTGSATTTFYPKPTASISGVLSYCPPATSTSLTCVVGGGTPSYTYSWSSGASTSTVQVSDPTNGAPGTTYSVLVTDAHGCSDSASATVIANGVPAIGIYAIGSLCAGADTLVSTVSTATSYTWSAGSGGSIAGPTNNYTCAVNTAGTYTLALTINSCTTSATYSLATPITPTITLRDTTVCSGTNVTLPSSVSPTDSYSYAWTDALDSLIGMGTTLSVDSAGVYNLTVMNNNTRCVATKSVIVSIAQNPTVTITDAGNKNFCVGKIDSLFAHPIGGTGPYTYSWSPQSGTNDTLIATPTGLSINYSVTVTDSKGCTADTTINLKQSNPHIFVANNSMCPGKCVVLRANGSGTQPITYTWTNTDGSQVNNQKDTICTPGTYTITMTDKYGCVAKDSTVDITYNPVPNADFTWSPNTADMGTPTSFTSTSTVATGSINAYNWNFGDGAVTDTSSAKDPTYTYVAGGTYTITLIATSDKGCADTTTKTIDVQYIVSAPNIITPNGDGINEYLAFKNLEYFPGSKLEIFDRWGLRLYSNTDYKNDWTGKDHTDGTYFYILEITKKSQTLKGFFENIKGK